MKGIIGKKLGMTQIYDKSGAAQPVTVIEAGPCTVTAIRTRGKHGYSAIQLAFGRKKVKNATKAAVGHVKAAGMAETPPAVLREVRLSEDPTCAVGDKVTASAFAESEFVDVTGIGKGRGFQGAVRRYGFKGGRASHGGGWVRRTGSIGMKARPGKVHKGHRMPGHMGNERITVQNLTVAQVRADDNLLLIRGAVPGPTGGTVLVRSARKK